MFDGAFFTILDRCTFPYLHQCILLPCLIINSFGDVVRGFALGLETERTEKETR